MSQVALGTVGAARRPIHLWVVGILSLLWNAFGVFDFLAMQLRLDFYVAQLTGEQLAYFDAFPGWMVAVWAAGVGGAFAGSVGLLLARAWSVWMFAVSLGALVVSSIYNFGLRDGAEVMGTAGLAMSAVITVVALALLVYSARQKNKGVLA